MKNNNKNITFEIVLKSLKNDFDAEQRKIIFEILKNNDFQEDELAGIKLLLQEYNWNFKAVNQLFEDLNNKIDFLETKHNRKFEIKTFNFFKYAAILIPFFAIIGFYLLEKPNDIDTFYIKEKGLPNLMSNESNLNWNSVMEPYKKGDFYKAYEKIIKINEMKKQNDTAVYFKAVIAYELKNYEIANKDFQKTLTFEKSAFIFDAKFRLGFSLYKADRRNEAKKVFQKIQSEKDNPFQSEATKIMTSFF